MPSTTPIHSAFPRRAIIVGSNGQDGRHLANLLRRKGYQLVCVTKGNLDITNKVDVHELVSSFSPHEIYLLAAYHHSAEAVIESDEIRFERSLELHATSTIYFLEAMAHSAPEARLFFAASSHIFPDSGMHALNEDSIPRPENIYAITKYGGMLACKYYRENKGVFASCGVLFNHESSLRPPHFLSRKIAIAAARVSRKQADSVELGNLDAVVDWGYAPDYVDAMRRILQVEYPSDYVIATGKAHTVREFAEIAFRYVGLDYRDFVKIKPDLLTKHIETRIGDASKLARDTGWKPTMTFAEMVQELVRYELSEVVDTTHPQASE
jgi:GDPmannose 4,6-dehydratase